MKDNVYTISYDWVYALSAFLFLVPLVAAFLLIWLSPYVDRMNGSNARPASAHGPTCSVGCRATSPCS